MLLLLLLFCWLCCPLRCAFLSVSACLSSGSRLQPLCTSHTIYKDGDSAFFKNTFFSFLPVPSRSSSSSSFSSRSWWSAHRSAHVGHDRQSKLRHPKRPKKPIRFGWPAMHHPGSAQSHKRTNDTPSFASDSFPKHHERTDSKRKKNRIELQSAMRFSPVRSSLPAHPSESRFCKGTLWGVYGTGSNKQSARGHCHQPTMTPSPQLLAHPPIDDMQQPHTQQ